jgi:threonine dehydrogenase-like Zn-dependent dehydrogenase
MPATDYPRVLEMIASGVVDPGQLVTGTVSLEGASEKLESMGGSVGVGVTVIVSF